MLCRAEDKRRARAGVGRPAWSYCSLGESVDGWDHRGDNGDGERG